MCSIIGYLGNAVTLQEIRPFFDATRSRGPDMTRMLPLNPGFLGFHRLAIMGLDERGMQPFVQKGRAVVCNGELYGFRALKKELEAKGYTFAGDSDCELLLPLFEQYGIMDIWLTEAFFSPVSQRTL